MFNYVLELPIEPKDAKRRGIRSDIGKLLIRFEKNKYEKELILLSFGKLILASKKEGSVIHAQPINSFPDLKDYKEALDRSAINYWLGSNSTEQKKKKSTRLTAECDSAEKCLDVLKTFNAEAIVFFNSKAGDKDIDLEKRLAKAPYFKNYEFPYLEEIDRYDLFIFFAEDHMSLEILGKEYFLINCFIESLKLESRFSNFHI